MFTVKSCRFGDEKKSKCVVVADKIQRCPLSPICVNKLPPAALEGSKLSNKSDGARGGFSCKTLLTPVVKAKLSERVSSDIYSSKIELHGEGCDVQKTGVSLKDGSPFSTPLRQHARSYECESSSESNSVRQLANPDMNVCVMTSPFLDDDFDESIFERIDELCEQIPFDNSERKDCKMDGMDGDLVIKNHEDDISTTNVDGRTRRSEILKSEEIFSSAGGESSGAEKLSKPVSKLSKNMPEEYTTYIQALNDRQQEAACSDISIPLVIVAGPGSGKVYLYLIVGTLLAYFNDLSILFVFQTSTMVGRVLVLLSEVSPSYECLHFCCIFCFMIGLNWPAWLFLCLLFDPSSFNNDRASVHPTFWQ